MCLIFIKMLCHANLFIYHGALHQRQARTIPQGHRQEVYSSLHSEKEEYFMARRQQLIDQLSSNPIENEVNPVESLRQRTDTRTAF